jgi:hypothetical protein
MRCSGFKNGGEDFDGRDWNRASLVVIVESDLVFACSAPALLATPY